MPNTASLIALRRQETREEVLRSLLEGLCPDEVNPELWMVWFKGGKDPHFVSETARSRLHKPRVDRSTGKALSHSTKRIQSASKKVEAARRDLEEAERELAAEKAFDAAILQWAVSEHLVDIMSPMFAMGPAWTIMRAVSAYAPPELLEAETALAPDPKRRQAAQDAFLRERSESTERMLAVLDLWSGDADFESDIRAAVEDVVKRYEPRAKERAAKGVRDRSAAARRGSVRPETATERSEVLDGLRRA